jgi:hypothetical protein
MSATRAILLAGLSAMSLGISACGTIDVKPKAPAASRGVVDDPRTARGDRVACLKGDRFSVQEVGNTDLLINGSVRVHFDATPGASEWDQIRNAEQGAEAIGGALLYPGNAPDGQLGQIEACIAQGVKG